MLVCSSMSQVLDRNHIDNSIINFSSIVFDSSGWVRKLRDGVSPGDLERYSIPDNCRIKWLSELSPNNSIHSLLHRHPHHSLHWPNSPPHSTTNASTKQNALADIKTSSKSHGHSAPPQNPPTPLHLPPQSSQSTLQSRPQSYPLHHFPAALQLPPSNTNCLPGTHSGLSKSRPREPPCHRGRTPRGTFRPGSTLGPRDSQWNCYRLRWHPWQKLQYQVELQPPQLVTLPPHHQLPKAPSPCFNLDSDWHGCLSSRLERVLYHQTFILFCN